MKELGRIASDVIRVFQSGITSFSDGPSKEIEKELKKEFGEQGYAHETKD